MIVPQPTKSKLAVVIYKLTAYFPLVSLKKKLDLEKRIHDLGNAYAASQRAVEDQQRHNRQLHRDYYGLLSNIKMPKSVATLSTPSMMDRVDTARVDLKFEPLRYSFVINRPQDSFTISDETEYLLEAVSRDLAYTFADQHAKEIFETVKKQYNVKARKK